MSTHSPTDTIVELEQDLEPLNLDRTLLSGQVFRWRRNEDCWVGVVDSEILRLRQRGEVIEAEESGRGLDARLRSYFRLDDKYREIIDSIDRDEIVGEAIKKERGLRLIRQNPWECTLSFICATNSNIPSIKRMIENLCDKFGEAIESDGVRTHAFPTPERLANADYHDLRTCGLGYRAKFIKKTASKMLEERGLFDELLSLDYQEAKSRLMTRVLGHKKNFPGIGPKVADCILLFSLEKLEAFPTDVWIARTVTENYGMLFDRRDAERLRRVVGRGQSLGLSTYSRVSEIMMEYFGKYAGYAQEFLYYHYRTRSNFQPIASGATRSPGA